MLRHTPPTTPLPCPLHSKLECLLFSSIPTEKKSTKKKKRWKQDAFEDTVTPLYNAPVYSGHPEYYGQRTTSRNFQLPYIFCKVELYTEVTLFVTVTLPFPMGDLGTQV